MHTELSLLQFEASSVLMPLVTGCRRWTHRENARIPDFMGSDTALLAALGDAPCFPGDSDSRGRKKSRGREGKFYPKECSPGRPSSRVSSRQGGGRGQEAGMGILEA